MYNRNKVIASVKMEETYEKRYGLRYATKNL